MSRAKATDSIREKKERIEVFAHDMIHNKIFFDAVERVPDKVLNYPPIAQNAYRVTFNNNLMRWGDINFAFQAAWKALEKTMDRLRYERSQGIKHSPLGVLT